MSNEKLSYFKRVQALTPTRYWVNNPTRAQAAEAIRSGAIGCTTNPAALQKVCADPIEREYVTGLIKKAMKEEADDSRVVEMVQRQLVLELARLFKPIYDSTGGQHGFVSIQGDPFNESSERILEYGCENAACASNIIVKVPVTVQGMISIAELLKRRVAVLATEVMSVAQFIDIAELYEDVRGEGDASVLIFAQIAGIFDEYLGSYVREQGIEILPDYMMQAGLAIMKRIEQLKNERGYSIRSMAGGARGTHHFTEMVGADSAVTINWITTSEELLEADPPVIERFQAKTPAGVIQTLRRGVPVFRQAYDENGLPAEKYEEFGPVGLFRSQFEKGWSEALSLVAKCRAGEL